MTAHHPAIVRGATAVITGAAGGIGLAVAQKLAGAAMNLCLADRPGEALDAAIESVKAAGAPEAAGFGLDLGDPAAFVRFAADARAKFGAPTLLMNNAGAGSGGKGKVLGDSDAWDRVLGVNFRAALAGVQAFAPAMIAAARPAAIINTGSKQGITTPPGDAAYNVSKAALKVMTEALAHELRTTPGCTVTAHLLIPGFTYSGLIARHVPEKPASAWTCAQVADFLLPALARGDFYILCPDNETPRELDEKRILWSAGDIVENRPALSRWHPDFADAFTAYMQKERP